jgi:hypothetical protein
MRRGRIAEASGAAAVLFTPRLRSAEMPISQEENAVCGRSLRNLRARQALWQR